jgi:type III secretion translocon protein HrpF
MAIPEVSQLAKAAAVGDKAIAGLANIGTTAIEGGNVGKAAKDAGIGLGETAVGSVIPGGGAKAITGLADVAGRVAKQGGEEIAKEGYKPVTNSQQSNS